MFNSLLFVCVGNICRSPMAAGVFANRLTGESRIIIDSAGLYAVVDSPAVSEAQQVMQEINIDISGHRAKQLTCAMISSADLVLVMEQEHKQAVEKIMPASRGKVYLLGKWSGFEVPDPYCKPVEAFSKCLQLIERAWQDWQFRIIK